MTLTLKKYNNQNKMIPEIKTPVYMDYQATTPVDPRVLETMMPYFTNKFGNPHSKSHAFGWESEEAVETARKQIAYLINTSAAEIIFTSGATESNNLAIKGVANFYKQHKNHLITAVSEHKCVIESCRHLEKQGFEVTYLPINQNGLIDMQQFKDAITDKTLLVSIMHVNNEIGVIQDIEQIGKICRDHQVFFHTDAAQSFGKIPIDVEKFNIDLLSISGHKIYGPKGIGALYIRRRPRVKLSPLFSGGNQEMGFRSGTIPTPLAVGIGAAADIAKEEMAKEHDKIKHLSKIFLDKIQQELPDTYLNGDAEKRYPGNISLSFGGIEGESLLVALRNLAVSSGSACASSESEPSYVLRELNVKPELTKNAIRFGIGRFTTDAEIEYAAELVVNNVKRLRNQNMSA